MRIFRLTILYRLTGHRPRRNVIRSVDLCPYNGTLRQEQPDSAA